MITIKWVSVGLAVAAAVCGLIAARYWLRASKVPIRPTWDTEPGEQDAAHQGWTFGMLQTSIDSANLNAKAARWTAAAVVLSVASVLVGTLAQF